jgi:P27 family predicted phage terminase small subunit
MIKAADAIAIADHEKTLLEPPDWLEGDALEEWNRVVPDLANRQLLVSVDTMILSGYCSTFAEYRQYCKIVQNEGRIIRGANGEPKLHPAVRQSNVLLAELRRMANEFGFSPAARTKIVIEPLKTEEQDAFDEFQAGMESV